MDVATECIRGFGMVELNDIVADGYGFDEVLDEVVSLIEHVVGFLADVVVSLSEDGAGLPLLVSRVDVGVID